MKAVRRRCHEGDGDDGTQGGGAMSSASSANGDARPRVLVVEDDLALRDFVSMALEDLEAEVVLADSLVQALAALDAGPVSVVLTDLSLGDGSGHALIERLLPADGPMRACVVVFSGGIDAALEAELIARGVWRVIRKPAPVAAISACVRAALQVSHEEDEPPAATPAEQGAAAAHDAPLPASSPTPAGVRDAATEALVRHWFDGEWSLYEQFLRASRPSFARAVAQGDAAVAEGDDAALVSLCHRLKTQLAMLGAGADSRLAIAIESSMQVDRAAGAALWQALRGRLLARASATD